MTSWDVIIVGAGPAGAMAGKYLAEAGKKVLIIERARLPRNKVCSGIVSTEAAKILKKEFGHGIPPVLLVDPPKGKGIRLKLSEKDDFIDQPYEFYNVWRRTFDYWLLLKASEKGVSVMTQAEMRSMKQDKDGVTLTAFKKNLLTGERELLELSAPFMIAADGGTSRTRRILYPDLKAPYAHAYQEYWTFEKIDLDLNYFHAFVSEESPVYDSLWIKDGLLMINTNETRGRKVLETQARFISYLQENHGLKLKKKIRAESIYQDVASFSECNFLLGKDRVLLAGEAGQFMDIFGQGIPAALRTGKEAALAILDSESPSDLVEQYEKRLRRLIKSLKRNWKVIREMGGIFG
ncbi:MAG: NAD(P)/FAD-dependent oxidoreductase [Candidatus Helarchaeales archaeon]